MWSSQPKSALFRNLSTRRGCLDLHQKEVHCTFGPMGNSATIVHIESHPTKWLARNCSSRQHRHDPAIPAEPSQLRTEAGTGTAGPQSTESTVQMPHSPQSSLMFG